MLFRLKLKQELSLIHIQMCIRDRPQVFPPTSVHSMHPSTFVLFRSLQFSPSTASQTPPFSRYFQNSFIRYFAHPFINTLLLLLFIFQLVLCSDFASIQCYTRDIQIQEFFARFLIQCTTVTDTYIAHILHTHTHIPLYR